MSPVVTGILVGSVNFFYSNFLQGGGQAKCTKGYWWQIDECEKYTMCNKPDNPKNGEYKCFWEDFDSKKEAKKYIDKERRSADDEDIDYDRQEPLDSGEFNGNAEFFKNRSVAGTNGTDPNTPRLIQGFRSDEIPTKKLVCKLKCNPGKKLTMLRCSTPFQDSSHAPSLLYVSMATGSPSQLSATKIQTLSSGILHYQLALYPSGPTRKTPAVVSGTARLS